MDRHSQKTKRMIQLVIFMMLVSLGRIPGSSISSAQVEKFSSAKSVGEVFNIVSEIELQTTENCPIAYITDMAVDSRGHYIVADGWQSRGVYVFGPDGTFIKELGEQGQGPGEYANPVSVEISQGGEIWVADFGNNRISIYSGDMEFERQIICRPRILYYLHLNSRNEIFMYRSQANPLKPDTSDTIFRYDDEGNHIDSFAPFPEEALKVKFWAGQDGMIIGGDDVIYEMSPLYYRIRKFSPKGELITSFARKTELFEVITKEGKRPIIVYGPFYLDDGLVIAHVNEHLEIYDTDGRFIVGELPFTQRIVAARGNRLYAELWEDTDDPQDQLNPKIISYQLR